MKTRPLIVAGALSFLLAPIAFASSTSSANEASCKTLETQFDKDVQNYHAADISKARLLRTEGAELCTQGKALAGEKKLKEAVKMLGKSPASN